MVDGVLQITNLHKWFKEMVVNWIELATQKCRERIQQAIDFDEVRVKRIFSVVTCLVCT